ncbi:MAG: hypothetical protein ACTH28_00350 [Brevibacterium aurantiacum]|uniref:hypothetical protein n=1 Tax=Brevibacterium aurantiacum TaxID=273384 RepID=UPI001054E73B|nr:hypothetical protein [Brevibacterium aurantiacum]
MTRGNWGPPENLVALPQSLNFGFQPSDLVGLLARDAGAASVVDVGPLYPDRTDSCETPSRWATAAVAAVRVGYSWA